MVCELLTDELRALGCVLYGDGKDAQLMATLAEVQMPSELGRCVQFALRMLAGKGLPADVISVYEFISGGLCGSRFPHGAQQATFGVLLASVLGAFPKVQALAFLAGLPASDASLLGRW